MSRTVRMPVLLVAVLVAMAVGALLANRLPYGEVPLTVEEGVARLTDPTYGQILFDGEDGTQLALDPEAIVWSDAGGSGEGLAPPCLRPGEKVPVRVGYRWLRLPDGGSRPFGVWLGC